MCVTLEELEHPMWAEGIEVPACEHPALYRWRYVVREEARDGRVWRLVRESCRSCDAVLGKDVWVMAADGGMARPGKRVSGSWR